MDLIALLSLRKGRLAPKPFAVGVLIVWIAGIASQFLLNGEVVARIGLEPFIAVQAVLIWIWLVLHIRRLRDAGEGPAAVIGVTLIYILSICFLLLLAAFFAHPDAIGETRQSEGPPPNPLVATLLVVFLFNIFFTPDFGVFSTIFKILILIAFAPAVMSLLFSIRTGMRKRVP